MSVRVDVEDLAEQIERFGDVAFLVTTGDGAAPHVVSVVAHLEDGKLVAGAGTTTARNITSSPRISMLWAPVDGGDYCLIVDGDAHVDGEGESRRAVVHPDRAVLHRMVDASGDGPSCITVLDQR